MSLSTAHPKEVRERIRRGEWVRPTAGCAAGYVQANLVVLPRDLAYEIGRAHV